MLPLDAPSPPRHDLFVKTAPLSSPMPLGGLQSLTENPLRLASVTCKLNMQNVIGMQLKTFSHWIPDMVINK